MNELVTYTIGYTYSLLIGTVLTHYLSDLTGKAIGKFKEGEEFYRWTAGIVGVVERLLYTSALLFDKLEFIGIWFLLKAVSQWRRWGERGTNNNSETLSKDNKGVYRERANFNSYLVNTGISLAYGVLGGQIICWLKKDDILTSIIFGSLLVLLNIIFIIIAYIKLRQSQKSQKESSAKRTKK